MFFLLKKENQRKFPYWLISALYYAIFFIFLCVYLYFISSLIYCSPIFHASHHYFHSFLLFAFLFDRLLHISILKWYYFHLSHLSFPVLKCNSYFYLILSFFFCQFSIFYIPYSHNFCNFFFCFFFNFVLNVYSFPVPVHFFQYSPLLNLFYSLIFTCSNFLSPFSYP